MPTCSIYVGGPLGKDAWYFGGGLSARSWPLGLCASGFFSSWGSFSLTTAGTIDLSIAGTGIEGSLTGHVSYCEHERSGSSLTQ